MKRYKIYNGVLLTPWRRIDNGCLIVEDGKILDAGGGDLQIDHAIEIDAKGNYISPGFMDIHIHGGGGYDFMDGTVDAYLYASKKHAEHGTTSMVPTTLTSTNEELKSTFDVFKQAKNAGRKGAELLGIHIEGPYFSLAQKGAQDARYIRNPDPKEYKTILEWSDDIIRWSAAPELEGSITFGKELKERGILPSIAHSDAIYEEVMQAFENGFTHITHLYSSMSGVRRINAFRFAGVIESAFIIDDMTVEIIADGVHLPASLLKMIYKIKGPERIALVTDSMRAAGMPEGESILGSLKDGQKVIVEDGVAKLMDRSAFAGSVATMDRLVRNMVALADVPLVEAVRMASLTPASIMGIHRTKGSLTAGKDADIVLFDKNIHVQLTMVGGEIVYREEGF